MAKFVFLGRLVDIAGTSEMPIDLAGRASLAALLARLPDHLMAALTSPKVRIAVNGALVAPERSLDRVTIEAVDEIAFLPPVSGG